MKTFLLPLALLVSLVSPCTAQTEAAKPRVSLKTEIVFVRPNFIDTADMSHVNFDVLPFSPLVGASLPPPEDQEMLEYASGYPVILLRQKIVQQTPVTAITEALFFPPAVSAINDTPVTISFHEAIPDPLQPDLTLAAPRSLPHVKQTLLLEGSLTFTPHINPNKTITLDLFLPSDPAAPQATGKRFRLRPVASGDPLLIRNFFPDVGSRAEISSAILLRAGETLLIFVTPTLVISK